MGFPWFSPGSITSFAMAAAHAVRLRRRRHGLRVRVGGDEDLLVDAGGDLRGQQHLAASGERGGLVGLRMG